MAGGHRRTGRRPLVTVLALAVALLVIGGGWLLEGAATGAPPSAARAAAATQPAQTAATSAPAASLPACPAGAGKDVMIMKSCRFARSGNYGNVTIMSGARVTVADAGLTLKVRSLVAMGRGSAFLAGCPAPLTRPFHLVVTETRRTADVHGMGAGVIGSDGADLCLKGARTGLRFDEVDRSYAAGATTAATKRAMGLRPGDQVLFTASTNDPSSAQTVTVASVSGRSFTFTPALRTGVVGTTVTRGGRSLPMYTEVARLTGSDVVIEPAPGAVGSVMSMGAGTAQISGVDLHRMGSQFKQYCAHFHMKGAAAASYIEHSVCTDTGARGFVLHGTDGARFEDLVAYRSTGTPFLLGEDCPEKGNRFSHLLGANPRPARLGTADFDATDQRDHGPSAFWSCAPTNTFTDLHAAGVAGGWGIRLDFASNTRNRGLSASRPGNPTTYESGVISGLVAHAVAQPNPGHVCERFMCGTGVFLSVKGQLRNPNPQWNGKYPVYAFGPATLSDVVVWKSHVGVWAERSANVVRAAVGDTGRAFVLQDARLDQGLCVGRTGVGQRSPDDPACTEAYDFTTMVTNTVMADYGTGSDRRGAISFWNSFGHDQVAYYGVPAYKDVTMVNVARPFEHPSPGAQEVARDCAVNGGLAAWLDGVGPFRADAYLAFACSKVGTAAPRSTLKVVPLAQRAGHLPRTLWDNRISQHGDLFTAGLFPAQLVAPRVPAPPPPAVPLR